MTDANFLVCWNEYDDDEQVGESTTRLKFGLMTADKKLELSSFATLEGELHISSLPGAYTSMPYIAEHAGNVLFAVDKWPQVTPYSTVSIYKYDPKENTVINVIDDLTGIVLGIIGAIEGPHGGNRYLRQHNYSYMDNGLPKAWFGFSFTSADTGDVNYHYFSIDFDTAEVKLLFSKSVSDRYESGIEILTEYFNDGIDERPNATRGKAIYPRFYVGAPVSKEYDDFYWASTDNSVFVAAKYGETIRIDLYLIDVVNGLERPIYSYEGVQPIPILISDESGEILAFDNQDRTLAIYGFNGSLKANIQHPNGISYPTVNYQSGFTRAVMLQQFTESWVGDPSDPYINDVDAVLYNDGSIILVKDKHPWIQSEERSGSVAREYSNLNCLSVIRNGTVDKSSFWTQLKNTVEVI